MQTQIRDSKPIHIGEIITIGHQASQPMTTPNSINSQPITTRKRPPYTTPIRWPNEIISEHLDYQDLQLWISYIQLKQKTNGEWDEIAKKMPVVLRDTTAKILKECRQNGFIRPRVYDGELVWHQIMGVERNRKYNNQCDLCTNSMSSGTCKGKFINNQQGHRDFKKCWEKQ